MIEINEKTDILLIVDVQNDFITGSLAVQDSAEIVPIINKYMKKIPRKIFSRDLHPAGHISFVDQGGPWPDHCVSDTEGAALHADLDCNDALYVNKGIELDKDAYSAFDGTSLSNMLLKIGAERLFICGLATDYCVKATVLDALKIKGIDVYLLTDAIKAVNILPEDGEESLKEMFDAGAIPIVLAELQ